MIITLNHPINHAYGVKAMKQLLLCDNGKYLQTADLCEKYHLGIELQSFHDPDYPKINPEMTALQSERSKDLIYRSMHGPFADLCFGSYDSLIREATRNRFEYAYAMAINLKCTDVILHHGYVPGTSKFSSWLSRGKTFWQDFLDAKDEGITFHLENLLELDPLLISDVVATIGDKRLNICLDIGHVHCHSKISVIDWITKLNKQIGYVHLHNNFGVYDEHLGLEHGSLPMLEACHALEENAPDAIWALETDNDDTESSVSWLQDHHFEPSD
jgi:sugar phosphate isomerase/epimerase